MIWDWEPGDVSVTRWIKAICTYFILYGTRDGELGELVKAATENGFFRDSFSLSACS